MNALLPILIVVGVLAGLIALMRRADAKRIGPWQQHAVCKCGWWTKPAFGEIFFVHQTVCPDCGEPKEKSMRIVTRRWNGPMDDWEVK